MNILFLSRWFPWPTNNGSKIRIYNLLRELSRVHRITLLAFADQPDIDPAAAELRALCETVHVLPWRTFQPNTLTAPLGFLSARPRSAVYTFSPAMRDMISELTSSGQFDLVIASQWAMADYEKYFSGVPAIFEELELGLPYQQMVDAQTISERIRYGLSWGKHRRYIGRLLSGFSACTVVSSAEKELVQALYPAGPPIEVIPNCLSLADYANYQPPQDEQLVVFTGSFRYEPNYAAMVWFVEHVWPLILAKAPGAHLKITGDHANLPLPAGPQIELTGFVDDIKSLIAAAAVSIAPLQSGGGTRLKILEAMALKTVVVSTTKGAEGLAVEDGRELLLADQPDRFAAAVLTLLQDTGQRHKLTENAFGFVKQHYDWATVAPTYLDLIEAVAAPQSIDKSLN